MPDTSKLSVITALAQRDANRTGRPMAVLNLNRFNPLYVVREYPACYNSEMKKTRANELVCVCHPCAPATDADPSI